MTSLPFTIPPHLLDPVAMTCHKKGETLILQGYSSPCVYLILEGTAAAVCLLRGGETYTLLHMNAGEIIGEVEYFSSCHGPNTVELVTDCKLLKISYEDFRRWLLEDASFSLHIMKQLAYRLQDLRKKTIMQISLSLEEQVAFFLLQSGNNNMDKGVLCSEATATRRSINRILREFSSRGLVSCDRSTVSIRDREGLSSLCARFSGDIL